MIDVGASERTRGLELLETAHPSSTEWYVRSDLSTFSNSASGKEKHVNDTKAQTSRIRNISSAGKI